MAEVGLGLFAGTALEAMREVHLRAVAAPQLESFPGNVNGARPLLTSRLSTYSVPIPPPPIMLVG